MSRKQISQSQSDASFFAEITQLGARHFLAYFKVGDVLLVILALGLSGLLASRYWLNAAAAVVEIRHQGVLVATLNLQHNQEKIIWGKLGETRIEVLAGKVRIKSDPSPRQYCVKQGWLSKQGQVALCLPSQMSVTIVGEKSKIDSMSF
ncbi:MAG: NusG domain II-containing protein [Neisseriaceae bacterium]|nr:NusG domain II-containing protein [Neisseriaceae bacterium]